MNCDEVCPSCGERTADWARENEDWANTPDGVKGDIECGYCGKWLGTKEITEATVGRKNHELHSRI